MRLALVLGCLILLAGCQNVMGPRRHRNEPMDVSNTHLTIPEQQQRVRERLALPEPNVRVAPRTFVEMPGPHGR